MPDSEVRHFLFFVRERADAQRVMKSRAGLAVGEDEGGDTDEEGEEDGDPDGVTSD
jgi:hypothetical protein